MNAIRRRLALVSWGGLGLVFTIAAAGLLQGCVCFKCVQVQPPAQCPPVVSYPPEAIEPGGG